MTPDQLLAAYLNVAFFDNSAYGIEVAAEVYFSVSASQLTLPEAALLAGLVQSPTTYDPFTNPANALQRRCRGARTHVAAALHLQGDGAGRGSNAPLGLKLSSAPVAAGCASPQAASSAFFCDYVQHVLELNYPSIWKEINTTGGLAIYTTLNTRDQLAADHAVNYVQPPYNSGGEPRPQRRHRGADPAWHR